MRAVQKPEDEAKKISEEAEKDLLELADISTDKQLEDIKTGKLKKDAKTQNKRKNNS